MVGDDLRHRWLWIAAEDLATEFRQLEEEGREIEAVAPAFRRLIDRGDEWLWAHQGEAEALLDAAAELPTRDGYAFEEPSDLAEIRELRPDGPRAFDNLPADDVVADRIAGGWLGRCAGCLLGKAAEGVRSDRFWPFLKATDQWPIDRYLWFGFEGEVAEAFPDVVRRSKLDDVRHMPVDDDTNYTTAGMLMVKRSGPDVPPAGVGEFWLANLPLLATCTAERVAYRNLALHVQPPASATRRNPYREWIGAQIRADGLAYTAVGRPERAAELAWRDASISHVKNGIYGEMFVGAMIAAAPFVGDLRELLGVGLSEIPAQSRLRSAVDAVIGWRDEGLSYDEAVGKIHSRWNEHDPHDWCHTISNAAVCSTALLWGEGDFGTSVCRAVQPCFDTDCNGATVGSIMGMRLGTGGIGETWAERLNDTLRTSLMGYDRVGISEIARETFEVWRRDR